MIQSVRDASQVGEARRSAGQPRAEPRHGEDKVASNIMLVATEMATNLLKHGDGGSIAMDGIRWIRRDKGSSFWPSIKGRAWRQSVTGIAWPTVFPPRVALEPASAPSSADATASRFIRGPARARS